MKISELGDNWFEVYSICLEKYQIKNAIKIAHYYRPLKLYKYYSFDSDYWRKNVFDYQVAFNLPVYFNDPLDSRWFLDYEKILSERFKEIGKTWSNSYFGDESMFRNVIASYEEDFLYLHDLFCVSCFSTTPYSNPMWGHYADKHSGFCIEYDVALLPEEMQLLLPVVYVESPFDASMILDMGEIGDKFASLCPSLFKSKDWEYEKEWRIFLSNDGKQIPKIITAPDAISGVYFGLRSYGRQERDEIEKWAKNRNVILHQIERSYCSFELQSDTIEDIRSKRTLKGFLI